MSARADSSLSSATSGVPSVSIELPVTAERSPDGWEKSPLIAQLIAQGPGVMMYRFGAGPGPWKLCYGPVVVPPGKQLMSAVLIAPDGTPGSVATVIARSDVHAEALSGTAADAVSEASDSDSDGPSAADAVTVSVLVGRQLGTLVRRLGGSDRYDTGAIISASVPTHGRTVIIATGQKFPDALTASGLAGCLNASVLLVTRDSVPGKTIAEIRRLRAHHAIICGGPPSVSQKVVAKLRSLGLTVERLAGRTRYETAVAISLRIQKLTGRHDHVFVARGESFSDALIVSPLAYATRTPILLSPASKLWGSTATRLAVARYQSVTIVGSGLSQGVETGVRNCGGAVDRWTGSGPSDTSVQIAATAVRSGALSWKYVGVARSDIFPDALCGGALAGEQGGVILLTPPKSLDACVANALTAHAGEVRRCEIYGSAAAINRGVFDQIRAIFH